MDADQMAVKIRERRIALKISQEELARRAKVNVQTLINIELGHTINPAVMTLVKLCDELDLRITVA
jgi:transcriptional regulator with XRE-family HTH domain